MDELTFLEWDEIANDVADMMGIYGGSRCGFVSDVHSQLERSFRDRRNERLISMIQHGRSSDV